MYQDLIRLSDLFFKKNYWHLMSGNKFLTNPGGFTGPQQGVFRKYTSRKNFPILMAPKNNMTN